MKKLVAILLLLTMLVGTLAACNNRGNEPLQSTPDVTTTPEGPSNPDTPNPDNPTPEEPPVGDTWVDVWDQDPVFTPITNDEALQSIKGTQWFESFKSANNPLWTSDKTNCHSYEDGALKMVGTKVMDGTTAVLTSPTVSRSIALSTHYEAEFRIKVNYFGAFNAFYVSNGANRAVIYLMENKLRVGMEVYNSDLTKTQLVYADVGTDWHTYKIICHDEIFELYMDGLLLGTFQTQAWGKGNQIGFFTEAITEFSPSTWLVDYVSYTVLGSTNLKINTPVKGATVGTGTTDVEVALTVSSKLSAENETVSFYLNDAYAGSAKVNQPTMSFKDLTPGAYTVYAKCGSTYSEERVFYIDRSDAETEPKNPVYTTAEKLMGSYVLKFKLNGNGTLTAGDGFYPLNLSFTNGKMTYKTLTGDITLDTGNGDYIVVVDGGVAWIYCNGKMLVSYRMPYAACDTKVTTDGGVSNLAVEAYGATLYEKTFSGSVNEVLDVGYTSHTYAMEFEYTKGSDLTVSMVDGMYFMNLMLRADGTIKVTLAPQLVAYEETLAQAKDGKHMYRIVVSGGIAQLYVDNVWAASWRLPTSIAETGLFVCGSGIGTLRITEIHDRFYYSGNRTDADWNDYFAPQKTKKDEYVDIYTPWESEARVLKVYSNDTTVSATLDLTANTTGSFYLFVKYFNGLSNYTANGVVAGYDFDAKCFKLGKNFASLSRVGSTILPANKTQVELKLEVIGTQVTIYCDGEVVATGTTNVNGWGNAGYADALTNGTFKSFSYMGDGNPLVDSATTMFADKHTVGMYELSNKVVMVEGSGYIYESTDGGYNFSLMKRKGEFSYNTIVLKSGKILSLQRRNESGDASKKYYVAHIFSSNGITLEGTYRINTDTNSYRFTMNGKVMQTSNGRIIFVSGETENEENGMLWIYYSDDDGKTWKKSDSIFNQATTGENLQEGAVVELPDGTLRMYARNDSGFLVYSDSRDNGVTWELTIHYSNFISVVSAFNVRNDPHTGDLYLAWEYNNVNDFTTIQFPRTRLGLAVSSDGGNTWDYVGDVDESENYWDGAFNHWNIGVWPMKDAVYVTVGKTKGGDVWYNYTVRIGKDTIKTSARFNSLHTFMGDTPIDVDGTYVMTNGVLAISATTKRVFASGDYYQLSEVNGKRTMLTVEMIASFLHGKATVTGDTATIKLGAAEYVFTAGSKTALINGEQKEMTFEAVSENGTVSISIEDLDNLLGLTTKCTEHGAIVITIDPAPARLGYLLAQAGIW